jgi:hypothetical protein
MREVLGTAPFVTTASLIRDVEKVAKCGKISPNFPARLLDDCMGLMPAVLHPLRHQDELILFKNSRKLPILANFA